MPGHSLPVISALLTIIDSFNINARAQLDKPLLWWQSLIPLMPRLSLIHLGSTDNHWQLQCLGPVRHTFSLLPDKFDTPMLSYLTSLFLLNVTHSTHFCTGARGLKKILMHTQPRYIFDCLKFRKGKCLEVLHYLVHLLLGQKRLYRKFLPNIMMYFKFTLREHYYSCFI